MAKQELFSKMCGRRCIASALTLACVFLFWVAGTSIALSSSRPIILTDAQLDLVNAGYVLIGIDARASAELGNPVAVAITLASVEVGVPQEDGYIYTVAEGYGYAYAGGEIVITSVNVDLDTDEEIVRSSVHGISNQTGRDYQMLLPAVGSADASPTNERLDFVTVRVVTRRPVSVETQP